MRRRIPQALTMRDETKRSLHVMLPQHSHSALSTEQSRSNESRGISG